MPHITTSTSIIIKEELIDILLDNKGISLNLNKTITNISFNNKNTMSRNNNPIVLKNHLLVNKIFVSFISYVNKIFFIRIHMNISFIVYKLELVPLSNFGLIYSSNFRIVWI